ncbi:hypothetical protein LPJ66_003912 [Kickxella alabastrina]|uniref:Uncharacterized protein n=1 Tax=Kickxella alabastrina TaxID=61397 RepID=A0ACC1IML7_9FUNG|nr:hypothetical protein LPJ66_003912 [Kickxella alabastrina]
MARTCYYELLEVERGASDSDLKRAYRKQALIWHPDKNHGNTDESTRIFAEIKEAYETLSDPQERAWYDNHREQILRGDDYMAAASASGTGSGHGQGGQSANVSFVSTDYLMKFFILSSFRGFDDSPSGFYTVYCGLFARLRDEELDVYDPETESQMDYLQNLDFGTSFTLFDEDAAYARSQNRSNRQSRRSEGTGSTLRDFYNFWTSFSSRKSFGWFDRFRLADAENRQIRRLMEKENKVLRDKAKREFTEAVQNLASWLKKRDPRFKRYTDEQQALQLERESERKRRVAERRAAVVEDASTYVRQAWEEVDYSKFLDEHLDDSPEEHSDGASDNTDIVGGEDDFASGIELEVASGDELDPENELVCFTCDKLFKTAAQKENHEKSKKHQKAVREIRREMMREERRMAKLSGTRGNSMQPARGDPALDEHSDLAEAAADSHVTDIEDDCTDDEDSILAQIVGSVSLAQEAKSKSKKSKKKRRQQANMLLAQDVAISQSLEPMDLDLDLADIEGARLSNSSDPPSEPDTAGSAQRVSKKELRRERQKIKEQKAGGSGSDLRCNVCGREFETRNHLFNHIKDTGHALANNLPRHLAEQIAQERSTAKGKKGKKGAKR